MPKKRKPQTITETLRQAIEDSDESYIGLQRETGVKRQSIMRFAKGDGSIRLDMADKLATFLGLELKQRKGR